MIKKNLALRNHTVGSAITTLAELELNPPNGGTTNGSQVVAAGLA